MPIKPAAGQGADRDRHPKLWIQKQFSICRIFGFILTCKVTDAARFDGRILLDVVTSGNTASDVWADSAYRSQRKKPRGKPMSECTAKANAVKSKVRARVKRVFAKQKDQMGLFIHIIGIKHAEAKITLVNLAYNVHRLIFNERRATSG